MLTIMDKEDITSIKDANYILENKELYSEQEVKWAEEFIANHK